MKIESIHTLVCIRIWMWMLCAYIVLCLCFVPICARTQNLVGQTSAPLSENSSSSNSSLLVLSQMQGKTASIDYERFIVQIRLVVDNYRIALLDVSPDDAVSMPALFSEGDVRQLMANQGAAVALWVTFDSEKNTYLLTLVVWDRAGKITRNAMVTDPNALEEELALVLREQLQSIGEVTAVVQKEDKKGESAQVEQQQFKRIEPIVDPAKESPRIKSEPMAPIVDALSVNIEARGPLRVSRRVGLGLFFLTRGGIWGAEDGSEQFGFGADGIWLPIRRLNVQFSLAAMFRLNEQRSGIRIFWWSLLAGCRLAYLWRIGPIELGPMVGAFLLLSRLQMTVSNDTFKRFSWTRFRAALGPSVRWFVTSRFALNLSASMGIVPRAMAIVNPADSTTLFSAPLVDWNLELGAFIFFLNQL